MWYCAMQVASYVGDETCGRGSEGKRGGILDRERRGENGGRRYCSCGGIFKPAVNSLSCFHLITGRSVHDQDNPPSHLVVSYLPSLLEVVIGSKES